MWITMNQITIREPLEIQTVQPQKYLKCTNELEYNGHMLHKLINYKVIVVDWYRRYIKKNIFLHLDVMLVLLC